MDFKHNYILENDVVLIRPLELNDFELLKNFAIYEPDLWKYSLIQANSEEKMKAYIELAIQNRNENKEYPFIVFDKRSNEYAGSTRFYDIQLENKSLQLGYTWYGSKFQGTGLNKNCKYLLLEFAFEQLEMERVEFRADNENKKSIAAMRSIGCVEEGIIRSHGLKSDGSRRDSIILSILKSEWENNLKGELKDLIK